MNKPDLPPQTPLHDGRPGLRSTIQVDIQQPAPSGSSPSPRGEGRGEGNSKPPALDFISSDATLDRYGEIISPAGWRLDSYQRNPVFQNAHQYGDIIFTLGRALTTEVRQVDNRPALYQRIQFATDANPIAKIAHALYAGKFLHSVSVGFIPLRWENGTADSGFHRKYLEQELLEVSAVAIPANPNALALAFKSGALEQSDLRDTLDLLRATLSAASPASVPTTATTSTLRPLCPLSPFLLQLAHQLRHLLKRT